MAGGRSQLNPQRTDLVDGRKTVGVAGTPERIAGTTTLPVLQVDITAETDNTGIITVGASTVVGGVLTRRGEPLSAGDTYTAYNVDLKDIWLDTTVNTDGVTFLYVEVT